MNRNKLIIFISLLGLPVMISFQNCSRSQSSDLVADTSTVSLQPLTSVNLNQISNNETASIDSNNNINTDSSVNTQIEDPEAEFISDIASAPAACEEHRNQGNSSSSNNGVISEDGLSIANIKGERVLSPEDFGGQTHISKISNSFGKVILCDLTVDNVERSGGRFILVNSNVGTMNSHYGEIGIYGNSGGNVENSNVVARRYSE
jgi:hypothetical protein